MHEKGIVHRDLKPENILLDNQDDIGGLKIIDFGTAKLFKNRNDPEEEAQLHERVGTISYMAPEVVKANLVANRSYSEKCDLWSIGVITYTILTKNFPITGEVPSKIEENLRQFNHSTAPCFTDSVFTSLKVET
jgi:serine/threonine protein kinase